MESSKSSPFSSPESRSRDDMERVESIDLNDDMWMDALGDLESLNPIARGPSSGKRRMTTDTIGTNASQAAFVTGSGNEAGMSFNAVAAETAAALDLSGSVPVSGTIVHDATEISAMLRKASFLFKTGRLTVQQKSRVKNCILEGNRDIQRAVLAFEYDGGSHLFNLLSVTPTNERGGLQLHAALVEGVQKRSSPRQRHSPSAATQSAAQRSAENSLKRQRPKSNYQLLPDSQTKVPAIQSNSGNTKMFTSAQLAAKALANTPSAELANGIERLPLTKEELLAAAAAAEPIKKKKGRKRRSRAKKKATDGNIRGSLSVGLDGKKVFVKPKQKHSKPKRWMPEEDQMLRSAVEKFGAENWKNIAALVSTRNHVQCRQRWQKVLRPGLKKGQWHSEEDETVLQMKAQGCTWREISKNGCVGRTPKQCRERWTYHLDPSLKKGQWTAEEDRVIVEQNEKLGNRWASIAAHLEGRTPNDVKIRRQTLKRRQKVRERARKEGSIPPYAAAMGAGMYGSRVGTRKGKGGGLKASKRDALKNGQMLEDDVTRRVPGSAMREKHQEGRTEPKMMDMSHRIGSLPRTMTREELKRLKKENEQLRLMLLGGTTVGKTTTRRRTSGNSSGRRVSGDSFGSVVTRRRSSGDSARSFGFSNRQLAAPPLPVDFAFKGPQLDVSAPTGQNGHGWQNSTSGISPNTARAMTLGVSPMAAESLSKLVADMPPMAMPKLDRKHSSKSSMASYGSRGSFGSRQMVAMGSFTINDLDGLVDDMDMDDNAVPVINPEEIFDDDV
jgi:myb proto-oncogene protein